MCRELRENDRRCGIAAARLRLTLGVCALSVRDGAGCASSESARGGSAL
jgi:hypothetical protein